MGDFFDDHPVLGCLGILLLLGGLIYGGIEYGPRGWAWAAAQWEAHEARQAEEAREVADGRRSEKSSAALPAGSARTERDGVFYALRIPPEVALPSPPLENGPPPLVVALMIQNGGYRVVEFTDAEADWELVLRGPEGELARTRKNFWIKTTAIQPGRHWIEHEALPLPPAEQWPGGVWRVTWTMRLRGETVAEITAETRYNRRP